MKPGTKVRYSKRFLDNLESLTGEKVISPTYTVLECPCDGCRYSGRVLIDRPSDFEEDLFTHMNIGDLEEVAP